MNTDLIFEQIAKQHLKIETLGTRKRDSLDFHNCSVWSLKKALQAAYDVGRANRNIKETTKPEKREPVFLGTIKANYRELIVAFGKPKKGDGYKIEVEWTVKLDRDVEVHIYNYKTSKSYDRTNPRIQNVREWSVDGYDSDAIEWVRGALGQETK